MQYSHVQKSHSVSLTGTDCKRVTQKKTDRMTKCRQLLLNLSGNILAGHKTQHPLAKMQNVNTIHLSMKSFPIVSRFQQGVRTYSAVKWALTGHRRFSITQLRLRRRIRLGLCYSPSAGRTRVFPPAIVMMNDIHISTLSGSQHFKHFNNSTSLS